MKNRFVTREMKRLVKLNETRSTIRAIDPDTGHGGDGYAANPN